MPWQVAKFLQIKRASCFPHLGIQKYEHAFISSKNLIISFSLLKTRLMFVLKLVGPFHVKLLGIVHPIVYQEWCNFPMKAKQLGKAVNKQSH